MPLAKNIPPFPVNRSPFPANNIYLQFMKNKRLILSQEPFRLTIDRLCHQLIEKHGNFQESCLIGIQPRGRNLALRLQERLKEIIGLPKISLGLLDITFYRDDFRKREKPLKADFTKMDFLVEELNVILVDDVLYTGRTVQAALTALQHYGRPSKVELICLVDRRFNRHLPIQADYIGTTVDALEEAYVLVEWAEIHGEDKVLLFPDKQASEQYLKLNTSN